MADNSEPTKQSTKRRLRAPAQTVREQAVKTQADSEKTKPRRVRAAAKKVGKPFAKPASWFSRLFKRQPFRFIGLVFHYIGLILVPKFVRNAFKELKLVTWPNFKQTRDLTFAVLMFAIVFGVVVAILDYGLDKLFKQVLLK